MPRAGHGEELPLTAHLGELRARLLVALSAFGVALALCFWQNHLLLRFVNAPLGGRRPITLGVTEPFTATLTVAAYAALVIALPVVLYQLYAFILPALTPVQHRVARPLLAMVPLLFVAGVAFGYCVVLPAALRFLLHFNQHQFNLQIRARDWYGFFGMTLAASGIVFQLPVGVLAAVRAGATTPAGLRRKRRHAMVACAVVAAALPGADPISMLLELVPLYALYELSILVARVFGGAGAAARATAAEPT